jgi:MYXO-CTERM domain-containing protein
MTGRVTSTALAFAAASLMCVAAPAAAQPSDRGNVPTETQERIARGLDNEFDWGWLGLIGLFGLAGLRRRETDYSHAI